MSWHLVLLKFTKVVSGYSYNLSDDEVHVAA
jgi:hypothetical protein